MRLETTERSESDTFAPDFEVQERVFRPAQCELVRDFARLEELSEEWDRLWRRSGSQIFQRFSWARAFWNTQGSKFSLCSMVLRDGANIVGILPLLSDGEAIRFLAEADYNDLICEERWAPSALAAAIQTLLGMPGRWSACILDNLSVDSRIVRHFSSLPARLRQKLDLVFCCPRSSLVSEKGCDVFTKLAQKNSLRRHQNRLQREGRLTFRHVDSRLEIHHHLPSFFRQHITRRALLGQRSHFQSPETRAFYAALVDEFNPCHDLRFAVLELDGRPIAYHFGFQERGKLIWHQSAFDIDLWHCSPGEVLIRKLLEYADKAGLREFDFTIGGEMYKSRFANFTTQNLTLYVAREPDSVSGRFGRSMMRATRTARKIKEELKTRPRLYNAVKKKWLRATDVVCQQQRLFRRTTLRGYLGLAARTLRNAIFAWDETLVFSRSQCEGPLPHRLLDTTALQIRLNKFSELALLSLKYPDELPWSELHFCRKRLANGDRIYTFRKNGELAHVVWAGMRSAVVVRNACQVSLSVPAIVLDGCWTALRSRCQDTWPSALCLLLREVGSQWDVWTYCLNPGERTRREIEAAGFCLRHRVLQVRVLSALGHTWILRSEKEQKLKDNEICTRL